MDLFFDDRLQSLTLLSLTRAVLAASGEGLPLPGLSFERFMSASWDDLGCGPEVRMRAGLALSRMFPSAGVKAGELGDEIGLRAALARFYRPLDLAGFVGARWRDCSGRGGSGRVIFMSSGSTGKPKAAEQSWAMLMQELEAVKDLCPHVKRVMSLTPLHHSYGFLFGALMALSYGLRHLTMPPFPPMVRENLAPGDLVVGFPDFWRNMPSGEHRPPENVFCLSATAPWPAAEQRALHEAGYRECRDIFGSSENGIVGWRMPPDKYFELLPYWERNPEDSGTLLRVFSKSDKLAMPLQDAFKWQGERRFRPAGRSDHAVQVSGVNVYPFYVSSLIAKLPGVASCKVRLMRPEEGRRLKAFIVPSDGWTEEQISHGLKAFFHEKLSAPERPSSLTFGPNLPKTVYGKDSDW